jgi:hypothetical protein
MKVPVVNREHYIQYIEYFNDLHFLHTDVFKWSKEIKQEYLKDLDTLQRLLDSPLFGVVEDTNTKLSKFGESIGFSYVKDLDGHDGNTYKIYKRSL